jgi:hypothetical protein
MVMCRHTVATTKSKKAIATTMSRTGTKGTMRRIRRHFVWDLVSGLFIALSA